MATVHLPLRTPLPLRARTVVCEIVAILASVRLAAAIAAGLALLALGGVLLPQLPEAVRSNPGATADWLDGERRLLGPAADGLYRLGFYDIFHSVWLGIGFGLLALSVVACTARRLAPTWRNVAHPVKTVPDTFLDTARSSVFVGIPVDPGALEQTLRRRHFHVERWRTNDAEWLFADRYPWAQLATFASHAALVLLMIGALVTHFAGFTSRLFIAEGATGPVFPLGHAPAMNLTLETTSARFDLQGRPLDYRSKLAITENGIQVKTCTVTASQPCSYDGYRIRQALYFPYGVDLEVRGATDGRVVYRESISLTGALRAPHLVVSDSGGRVVLDRILAFTGSVGGVDGTLLTVPGRSLSLWVGLTPEASGSPGLFLFEPGATQDGLRLSVPLHASATADGLRFEFAGIETTPSAEVPGLPTSGLGASTAAPPLVQLAGAGTVQGSQAESPVLLLSGIDATPVSLHEGQSAVIGNFEYRFIQQKPFVGVEVKKDRGEVLVWIGSALLVVGLCATLWIPRRRLWARVNVDSLRMTGIAPRLANLRRELEALAAEAQVDNARR
jgi:cytochrome c biogenesis protein